MDKILIIILIFIAALIIYKLTLKPKKIKTNIYKAYSSVPQAKRVKFSNRSIGGIAQSLLASDYSPPLIRGPMVGLGGPSQTTTGAAKKLTHTAFYANWGQFWPGAPDDNGRNSPNTFKNFIKNTDKIIYGFLMFGVMPTPFLICDSTTGTCIWDAYGGKFQKAKCWMGLVGGVLGYTNEVLKVVADRAGTVYKIIQYAADSKIVPFDMYFQSNSFETFPMYPTSCFTGSEALNDDNSGSFLGVLESLADAATGGLISDAEGIRGIKCPTVGRMDDFNCFNQLRSLKLADKNDDTKKFNPNLKNIASYGGWTWTHPGAKFSDLSKNMFTDMVKTVENRTQFITHSFDFLIQFGFDGVDFDWEYPGQLSAYDYYGFECLIKEYKAYAISKNKPDFLISLQCSGFLSGNVITLDLGSLPGYSDNGILLTMKNDEDYFTWLNRLYDIGLDNINIMAYDYYTASSEPLSTRPNAPLFGIGYENPDAPFGSAPTSNDKCASQTYSVVGGDSCWGISDKFKISQDNLLLDNNMTVNDCSKLQLGQLLDIPKSTWDSSCIQANEVCTSVSTYTVQAGDYMSKIADTYNISLDSLCAANNLTTATCGNINVGQVINLPTGITQCKPKPKPTNDIYFCLKQTLDKMNEIFGPENMNKTVLGLACYGRSFKGVDFTGLSGDDLINKTVGLPSTGPAPAGSYSNEDGILTFYEINNREWSNKGYNKQYGTSIAVDKPNGIWVSYDDSESLADKIKIAKSYNIGGVMTFTPQQDDFSKDYPLIKTVIDNL